MNQYLEINILLSKNAKTQEDKIRNETIYAPGYTLVKLRELIEKVGILHKEVLEQNAYIATLKGGFAKCNNASVAISLKDDHIVVAVYADEGIINQHTSEGVINELRKAMEES